MFENQHSYCSQDESTSDSYDEDMRLNTLDDGSIFVDRDPKSFRMMINFINDKSIRGNLSENEVAMLDRELLFWKVAPDLDLNCKRMLEMQAIFNAEPVDISFTIVSKWK